MKKILFLLTLTITAQLYSQTYNISNDFYTVEYSSDYEQPLKFSYQIPSCKDYITNNNLPRPSSLTQSDVKTSDNDDYIGNEYDKGHLAPVLHFNCDQAGLEAISTWLNMSLMHQTLNRGLWRMLEKEVLEEKLVNNNVFITIELVFDNKERVVGGALIPTSFIYNYKIKSKFNYVTDINLETGIATIEYEILENKTFIIPNDESVRGKRLEDFIVN